MMLKSLKLGAVVSKTGGEILGADMIYNYEQVLRQVTNKQTKRKKQAIIQTTKTNYIYETSSAPSLKHNHNNQTQKNYDQVLCPEKTFQQSLHPQVVYSNQKPAYYLNRQFKIICSELSDRFTSNEYVQTVRLFWMFAPVPATIWHKLDLVMLLTRGHGDTVFNKMFSSNFTNWAQLAKSTEIKSNSWNKYKYQSKYKYKW